jgi:hypothetical protein
VTAFVGALCLWLIYLSFQSVRILSPSEMAQMLALPPVHSLLDLRLLFGGASRHSPGVTIAIGAGLLVFRAALLGFLIALIPDALAGRAEGAGEGGYLGTVRTAAERMVKSLASLFLFETAFVVVLSVLGTIVESFLGLVGLAVVMVAEMHYLVFVPVIAVTEQTRPGDALSLALRLVRQSTRQSLFFSSGYVMITLFFLVLQAPFASASPSIQVWAYVLLASFVHVGVLAALVLRWLAVREKVLEGWTPRARTGWLGGRAAIGSAGRAP